MHATASPPRCRKWVNDLGTGVERTSVAEIGRLRAVRDGDCGDRDIEFPQADYPGIPRDAMRHGGGMPMIRAQGTDGGGLPLSPTGTFAAGLCGAGDFEPEQLAVYAQHDLPLLMPVQEPVQRGRPRNHQRFLEKNGL